MTPASNTPIPDGWGHEERVDCVVCPECAFTFDACHEDTGGGYSCPLCVELKLRQHIADFVGDSRQRFHIA